ncbi:RNA polymerase factor sigma-54 [Vibrio sp.]|nr:RNA polymerase factor sigma-54 [Vibrio sp.]
MKPTLQLKIGQHLSMTPQLQQAIRLLQLSTLDLQQEIQEALDSNPLLEADDLPEVEDKIEVNSQSSSNTDEPASKDQQTNADTPDADAPTELQDSADRFESSEISSDLEIDTTWDDIYSSNSGSTGIALDADIPVYQGETTESLHDRLLWQLELTPFSETDHTIAIAIIDAIDKDGYLCTSLEDLHQSFDDDDIDLDEIEAVRKRIQQFDPVGVASLDLKDCLLLQLSHLDSNTPHLEKATFILEHHIDELGKRDYKAITKSSKLKEDELRAALLLIQQLEPRPGGQVGTEQAEYVIPDVTVYKDEGKWIVSINPDSVPRIKVNQQYAHLGKGNNPDSQYIRTNLQEAKWLIKSLESRNETLLKVSRCIVEHQKDFLEHGEEHMKPMVLNDIALDVEMHESTISRVTNQKFMHTPRGIFELKYFFSSHVNTNSGGECSSTAIRALIKKLVAAENPSKPLSDSKIATLLAEQEIKVARRTIAKYRESLGIASSSQRKSLL